jgi:hypothetical protein
MSVIEMFQQLPKTLAKKGVFDEGLVSERVNNGEGRSLEAW